MGVNDKIFSEYPEQIATIVAEWGWEAPSPDLLELAALSYRMRGLKSGEALVTLGLISQERVDTLLERRPANTRTLEWIAQNDPSVRAQIEKVLTLRTDFAYYEALDSMPLHPVMLDGAVVARCDALSAVLVEIEERESLLVFSAYSEMIKYSTAGLEAQAADPIRQALKEQKILLAVAKQDQVIGRLSAAKGKDGIEASSNIVAMWFGSAATEKSERAIARIIDYGLSHQATDIAISPQRGKGSLVEMRRNGDMIPCPVADKLKVEDAAVIVDFLLAKANANPTLAKVKEPRDGNIIYRSQSGDAELRLSFIPINQPGEYLISVSIRLMARTEKTVELERLNIAAKVRAQISAAAKLSKGFILVVGGTNTGKSTTIAGALEENYRYFGRSRKRISLEKPVERLLRGVTQVNLPAGMEDAFHIYLKAVKRHDPDVIFIGEILDGATADVAVTAAISGHLVMSTTHANDTLLGYDSVAQMLEANKRYQFIESLSLVVAQDMVREVCKKCGEIHPPTQEERELFEAYRELKGFDNVLPERTIHMNPAGCDFCKQTGIVNILPINEVLPVTAAVKNAMFAMLGGQVISANGANHRDSIAQARTSVLLDAAMDLVSQHRIELKEALR
jgi:type II secretory ATPase GspE/PulE/Tfp pilus assembly ATPase PilB-like protein